MIYIYIYAIFLFQKKKKREMEIPSLKGTVLRKKIHFFEIDFCEEPHTLSDCKREHARCGQARIVRDRAGPLGNSVCRAQRRPQDIRWRKQDELVTAEPCIACPTRAETRVVVYREGLYDARASSCCSCVCHRSFIRNVATRVRRRLDARRRARV